MRFVPAESEDTHTLLLKPEPQDFYFSFKLKLVLTQMSFDLQMPKSKFTILLYQLQISSVLHGAFWKVMTFILAIFQIVQLFVS